MEKFSAGQVVDVVVGVDVEGGKYVANAKALIFDVVEVDEEVSYSVAVKKANGRPLFLYRVVYEPTLDSFVVADLWEGGLVQAYPTSTSLQEAKDVFRRNKWEFNKLPAYEYAKSGE